MQLRVLSYYDKPSPFDEVYPIVSFDFAQDDDGAQGDVLRHGERSRTMTLVGSFQIRTLPN